MNEKVSKILPYWVLVIIFIICLCIINLLRGFLEISDIIILSTIFNLISFSIFAFQTDDG
jgi:branched-subunit amino acid transport protein AzlD